MALLLPSTLTSLITLCLFNLAIILLFPMVLVIRPWPLDHSAGCGYCSLLLQSCFLVCVSALQPRPLSLCWWFCFWIWKLSLWVLVISVFVFDSLILVLHPDSWSLSLGYLGWDLSLGFLVFGFTLGPWNLIPGSWSLILGFQLLFIYLRSLAPDFDSRSCYWPLVLDNGSLSPDLSVGCSTWTLVPRVGPWFFILMSWFWISDS